MSGRINSFNTILYKVLSPANVGMILRSHVAFGGDKLIFLGYEKPWDFKQGSQAFSRKLEKNCELLHFANEEDFFSWAAENGSRTIAIEIAESSSPLPGFSLEGQCNLVVGNESNGLPRSFLDRCDAILHIPQFGPAACLNVAVSASVAQYEFTRMKANEKAEISGSRFAIRT